MTAKRAPRKRKELDITNDIGESIKKNFDCSNIKINRMLSLTDNQSSFYYSSQDPKTNIMFVDGVAGTAKAQPNSEPIATPKGFKSMGEIVIGDLVYNNDGFPTEVIGVYPQGVKKIYKVEFSDGTYTKCCGDHLWLTSTSVDSNKWKTKRIDGKKKNISKLPTKFEVRDTIEIKNSIYYRDKLNHMIPITQPVEYNSLTRPPIPPYILGQLLGDGCFRISPIRISTKDEETIKLFKDIYKEDFKHLSNVDYRILDIDHQIKDLGLYNLYSHEKFIPSIYKFLSVEDRISLIQGLCDADGTVSKGLCVYTTTSKQLADDITEVVNSLGGVTYITNTIAKLYGVSHKMSYKLHINLPEQFIPFKLSRKILKYKPNTKYSPKKYISAIEECGEEECTCIKVSAENSLYLTRNYIVTHNTYISVYSALELLRDRHIDQIIYIRTVVESSSRSIGALPGELDDKFSPYSMPLIDKLNEVTDPATYKALFERGYIKAIPVNFVRGLTFHNSAVIIDEAQNMTKSELITVLTRFGRNTRYFVCGDAKQTDIRDSGFEKIYDLFDTDFSRKNNIHCVKFDTSDVVRSPILKHITQVLGV